MMKMKKSLEDYGKLLEGDDEEAKKKFLKELKERKDKLENDLKASGWGGLPRGWPCVCGCPCVW